MNYNTFYTIKRIVMPVLLFILIREAKGIDFSTTPLNIMPATQPNILFSLGLDYNAANTAAYLETFNTAKSYDGYFDPNKCYQYYFDNWRFSSHYFYPTYTTSLANNFSCNTGGQRGWSGSFLNWLTMSKLDLLRKNLTGGTRRVDEKDTTVLTRSWLDGRGSMINFPDRAITASLVQNYTAISTVKPYIIANMSPTAWGKPCRADCNVSETLGFSFRIIDPSDPSEVGKYPLDDPTTRLDVVVKVCDPSVGLESNCTPYYKKNGIQYYKPTGLLQKYSTLARFGVASYPNLDAPQDRAGGVVLEPMKNIGTLSYNSDGTAQTNNVPEIDQATGIFIYDPDALYNDFPKSISADTVHIAIDQGDHLHSGLINYINVFGYQHRYDTPTKWAYPAGATSAELFYESIRYFSLPYTNGTSYGPTPEYTKRLSDQTKFNDLANIFFAIPTHYDDPIQNSCQRNYVVFIGSPNQDCDSRIPGGVNYTADSRCLNTHTTPSNSISGLSASTWINQFGANEGGSYTDLSSNYTNMMNCPSGTGRGCWNNMTPNIIGLSYWAHVNDIRPDLDGFQSINSYVMDWKPISGRTQDGTPAYSKDPTALWLSAKYGGFNYQNGQSTNPNDDISSWDNGSGMPKTFLRSDNPENLRFDLSSLFSSAVSNTQPIVFQSNGRIAINNSLNIQNTQTYKAFFSKQENNMWMGNLIKSTPSFSSSNGVQITYNNNADTTNFNDGAAAFLKDNTVSGQPRKIIAGIRSTALAAVTGTPFVWASLGTYTQSIFINGENNDVLAKQRIDYIRGDRSNEIRDDNPLGFRKRPQTVLGDIIDSSPVFVGPAIAGFSDSDFSSSTPSYYAFTQKMMNRKPMIYVGANDGMLHGFDANSLAEVFSFIPNAVLKKLVNFSSPSYTHDFFVNETPLITEIPLTDRGWSSILIGFLGTGGTGLFALDVTSPDDSTKTSNLSAAETNAKNILLWELNSDYDKDIGYILNRGQVNRNRNSMTTQVGKLSNGKFAVVIGNGYNSPNNSTGLVMVYLDATGSFPSYKKIMIPGILGGLSTPTPVDIDLDGIIDFVYAGDLNGNVWRFDLRGPETSWSVLKLFQANDPDKHAAQPIIQAPALMYHCQQNGLMVIVGTGKYFMPSDTKDTQKNTLYGLWDNFNNQEILRTDLVAQNYTSILAAKNSNSSTTPLISSYIISTKNEVDWAHGKRGWLMDTDNKILVPPYIANGMVNFNVFNFDTTKSCNSPKVSSSLFSLQACTGKSVNKSMFDINYDGIANENDMVNSSYASGVTSEMIQRIFDPSVWISPRMLHCTSQNCPTIQTGLSEFIGINLQTTDPSRLSWRQMPSLDKQ